MKPPAALCAGQATPDDDPWFSDVPAEQEFAKRVCRQCPTRVSCLAAAIARDEQDGIWGGVDMERRAVEQLTAEMAEGFLRPVVYGPGHGERARYAAGCGCGDCTAANTADIAARRKDAAWNPAPVTARETMSVVEQLVLEGMPA